MKKVIEIVTKNFKDASEDVMTTMMVGSEESINAISDLNEKNLRIMNDRGILALNSLSLVSKISNNEKNRLMI